MRVIRNIIISLLLAIAAVATAAAAELGGSSLVPEGRGTNATADAPVSFQAIMVIASDDGATDVSLAAYEATLRRVLRFKTYRRAGGGTARLAADGEGTLSLGHGYDLDLWITRVTESEIEFGIRWFKGDVTLANTKVTRPRRANTVIGGPATEDGKGTYAVIVTTI